VSHLIKTTTRFLFPFLGHIGTGEIPYGNTHTINTTTITKPFQTADRRIALVGTSQAGKSVLVNLIEGTCECQEWPWTGVPCSHAAYFSLADFIYGELRVGTDKQFWELVGPTKKAPLQSFPDMRNSGMRGLPRTFVPQGRKKKTAGRRKHKRIPSAMDGPAPGGSSGGGEVAREFASVGVVAPKIIIVERARSPSAQL